jgi:hypothetical protein
MFLHQRNQRVIVFEPKVRVVGNEIIRELRPSILAKVESENLRHSETARAVLVGIVRWNPEQCRTY